MQTFIHHRIVHDYDHPMEVRLRQLLLDFSLAHLHQISCSNLGLIVRLVGINFPSCLLETGLGLQQRLLQGNIIQRLAPSTLGTDV